MIEVEGRGGQKIDLKLGSCTRLESSTFLPHLDQNIYFKGILVDDSVVNSYIVSTF